MYFLGLLTQPLETEIHIQLILRFFNHFTPVTSLGGIFRVG